MGIDKKGAITAREIAAICGVSQGTVDRALNGRGEINAATKERILAVAAERGYRPNLHARRLVSGKSGLIGIVLFDLHNEYFSDLVMHLENGLREAGFLPVIMFSQKDPALERACIEKLCAMGVEGIVICPVNGGSDFEKMLFSLGIPIVTVGNRLNGIPHVGIDDRCAMYDMARHVIAKGYGRYLYFSPALSYEGENRDAQERRYEGFCLAARECGIAFETITRFPDRIEDLRLDTKSIVVASTDYYALRLIFAGVPAAQVTGFDNIGLLAACHIDLCTVDGHSADTARALAAFFCDSKVRGQSRIIPHELVLKG